MKARILLAILSVFMLAFVFAVAVSATEYTVTSDDEFKAAYDSATDGDTIVIKNNISATFNFGKSITYILDGDGIVWSAGADNSDIGKDVYILSRNGNNVFMPNGEMWCNSYSVKNKDFTTTNWTFGSLDGSSTVTLDLQKVKARLFYDVTLQSLNFKSGSIVTGINNTKVDNTHYLRAKTVNVYDGARIYGNNVGAYRGLFQANTLNIYGGEIYGNKLGEYGLIVPADKIASVNMYGGRVYENYFYYGNSGVQEGVFNNFPLNMYGGEICNNYIKISNAGSHSVLVNTKYLIAGSAHGNYLFNSLDGATLVNGVYTVEGLDTANGTEAGYGLGGLVECDYSVIFKNSDGSATEAYLIKDGTVKKSHSGTAELGVPSGKWSSQKNYCVEVTPDLTKQGTYYIAVAHTPDNEDFDCTTALECSTCKSVIYEATQGHSITESLVYGNYFAKGTYSCDCTNSGCTVIDVTKEKEALFTSVGYSAKTFGDDIGIIQSYGINKEAIEEYKGYSDFDFGIMAFANVSGKEVTPKPGDDKVVDIVFNNMANDYIEVKVVGIPTEYGDAAIVACIYAVDNGTFRYADNGTTSETVVGKSYNELK